MGDRIGREGPDGHGGDQAHEHAARGGAQAEADGQLQRRQGVG